MMGGGRPKPKAEAYEGGGQGVIRPWAYSKGRKKPTMFLFKEIYSGRQIWISSLELGVQRADQINFSNISTMHQNKSRNENEHDLKEKKK